MSFTMTFAEILTVCGMFMAGCGVIGGFVLRLERRITSLEMKLSALYNSFCRSGLLPSQDFSDNAQ